MQQSRLNVVPSIPEWHINQFDYNIGITNKKLDQIIWAIACGWLQIKYLGAIFRYPKGCHYLKIMF
jgi:hypothetical protein